MPKVNEKGNARPIVYKGVSVQVCEGAKELTEAGAKELLGWREAGKDEAPLFTDLEGKRIVCTNNFNNRPFQRGNAELIKQEVLRKRWQFNLESMIIGESGLVLSAQHRLIGFIFACQAWRIDPEEHPDWEDQPTLACLIAFGCSEADEVVNTIDTGKSRTLADVLFRSEYFKDLQAKDRKVIARIGEFALRTVWGRTGVENAYGVNKTHAEFLDMLNRHPSLLNCVRFIFDEETDDQLLRRYVGSLGVAAGFMYLMATSKSDPLTYVERNETELDVSNYEKAEEFWTGLANKDKPFLTLHKAFVALNQREVKTEERWALLAKAWTAFADNQPMNDVALKLAYLEDEDGTKSLAEFPTFGGIDFWKQEVTEQLEDDVATTDPGPEEIARLKAEVIQEAKNKKSISVGDRVWVVVDHGCHWSGILESTEKGKRGEMTAHVKVDKKFAGAGKIMAVPLAKLQKEKPND